MPDTISTFKTIGREKLKINEINSAVSKDEVEFFNLCNNKYEQKVELIAKKIAENPEKARIIMLAGPSASGKTTTSLKIQARLNELGCGAVTISMDDFFKNREETPQLKDGTKDFETVDALDTQLLKDCLSKLVNTGEAYFPRFSFKEGKRYDNEKLIKLDRDHVAIVEGLHALNPAITSLLPEGCVYKIYVSVSSDYVSEEGKVILSARDMRLIRRSVRDFNFRGSDVEHTLSMWDHVCHGEDLYVRPYKKYADMTVNSAFSCGPSLFKKEGEKLFSQVNEDSEFIEKATHILSALSKFKPMNRKILPSSCVLLEFFGGSQYY